MNEIRQDLDRLHKQISARMNFPDLSKHEKVELLVTLNLLKKQIRTLPSND